MGQPLPTPRHRLKMKSVKKTTAYFEKILKGKSPTPKDWENHIKAAHHESTGLTPNRFLPWETFEGLNSYEEILKDLKFVKKDLCIVDLACGEGTLIERLLPSLSKQSKMIGIDMSEDELELAQKRIQDPRLKWIQARAQEIPLPKDSVDIVLCHLGLMLMLPVDEVLAEAIRILKPGGKFRAIVTGAPVPESFFARFFQKMGELLMAEFPDFRLPKTGDPRVRSLDGLKTILGPRISEITNLKCEAFSIFVSKDFEKFWDFVCDTYILRFVPDTLKTKLQAILQAMLNDEDQKIPFSMAKISFEKRSKA